MNIRTLRNSLLKTLAGLFIAIPLALSPITANAGNGTIDESALKAAIKDAFGFNGTGEDTNKDYGQRNKGVSYVRTGYLCYMVDESGNNLSTAIALSSPGFYAIEGSEWIVTSRTGLTVDGWSGTAPWNVTPWQENGSSNVSEIRSYLMADMGDGTTQAQDFINGIWGTDISNQFATNEAFLVIETIMNFQFSTKNTDVKYKLDYQKVYLKALSLAQDQISNSWSAGRIYTKVAAIQDIKPTAAEAKYSIQEAVKIVALNYMTSSQGSAMLSAVEEEMQEVIDQKNSNGNVHYYGSPYIGTVPNMLDAKDSLGAKNEFTSFTNQTAPQAEKIQEDQCGFKACSASGKLSDSDVRNYGVAMVIISAKKSGQSTCDESIVESQPVHQAPKESSGMTSIVKNYRTKTTEGTSVTYTDDGCTIRNNVSNKILIENEPTYRVVGWAISTTSNPSTIDSINWNPPSQTKTGTLVSTVELDSTTEKTLYVLLEKSEEEEVEVVEEDYDYLLTESQVTRRVWFSRPDKEIHLTKTTLLEHDFNFTKPATDPQECAGHSYYTECKGHHDDHQATGERSAGHNDNCSRDKDGNIDCSDSHTESYTYTCTSCNAETYYNTDYACEKCTDTDYCLDWKWLDMNQNISLDATLEGADTIVVWENAAETYKAHTVKGNDGLSKQWYSTNGTDVTWSDELEQKYLSEYTNWVNKDKTTSKDWNYICLLARGQDLVTIAEWKNSGTPLKDMLDSGKFTEANQPQGTRYQLNKGTDTYYYEKFSAEFDKDTEGDYEVKWGPTKVMSQSAHKVSSDICSVEPTVSLMTPLTINDITVKVEVYIGKESLADQAITYDRNAQLITKSMAIQKNVASGTRVPTDTITFYPYIRMQYDTLTTTKQKVQVLGEYVRSIKTNAYGEVQWDTQDPEDARKLTVNSTQFSTHAEAAKESFRKGTVLPGGATLTLKVQQSDFRTLTVRTYQVILEGDGLTQVEKTTGNIPSGMTESDAMSNHEEFVSTVLDSLQNTKINQYVSTDGNITDPIQVTKTGSDTSNLVTPGCDISRLSNGSSTASTETKYYLQGAQGDSNSPYIDAKTLGTNIQGKYLFTSDDNGNIKMNGSTVLTKSQSSGLSGIAVEIDEKTKVISEFAASIERNHGSDPTNATWATGGTWYNEQFDGFTVIIIETKIQVGTWQPNERHTVLDPKLIPQQTKKTSSWSFFSTAWRTDNYSQTWGEGAQEKIGEFLGSTVNFTKYYSLFVSNKVIYIPNITTQDLR